jgi:hypothetical protein
MRLKGSAGGADPWNVNLRLLSRRPAPPPLVVPQVNQKVAVLADGARYGGRVDDIRNGCMVIAAPDASLATERAVLLEWRDEAGIWRMPGVVRHSQEEPFPTTWIRPTGHSECISEGQVASPGGGLRISARLVESYRLPVGTRIPISTVQLAGDRLAFWTILPLGPGDHVELSMRTARGEVIRAGLVVAEVHNQGGSWLGRVDCDAENPSSPAVARLVEHLLAAQQPAMRGAA